MYVITNEIAPSSKYLIGPHEPSAPRGPNVLQKEITGIQQTKDKSTDLERRTH